jgi:hypothetical protein
VQRCLLDNKTIDDKEPCDDGPLAAPKYRQECIKIRIAELDYSAQYLIVPVNSIRLVGVQNLRDLGLK